MLTALSTALTGLTGDATAVDVVGNNLANLNTVGYKENTVNFFDLVSQEIGNGGTTQVGMGVGTPTTIRDFSQGTINSASPLDLAIQGNGFLVVKTTTGQTEYTRAGDLKTDASGNLLTATGEYVQGWTNLTGAVNTTGPIGNITVPIGSNLAAQATSNVSVTANLDASTTSGGSFSTSVQIYDSLGVAHTMTIDYAQTGAGTWTWAATVPSSDLSGTGSITSNTGTLQFDTNGNLTSPSSTTAPTQISIAGLADGAADLTVNFNLYTPGANPTPLVTDYAQTSASSGYTQDGNAASQLDSISIGDGGTVVATYSNGQTKTVGQIAMANFVNPESLVAAGNNNYTVSNSTSNPAIGVPNSGGRGQILGASLESSTVDIATEFTNLMTFQRSYEANAKVVTSADQINQDTIALVR